MEAVAIESLDQDGRGVTHAQGKVLFIDGALPGEFVTYSSYRKNPQYEFAQIERLTRPSAQRTLAPCPYFGTCGGCSLQHIEPGAQVAMKQRVLEDALWHIGRIKVGQVLPPIYGTPWQYRYRARFAVRYVEKKKDVLVGFHEKRSSFVADMESCLILPKEVSALIRPLRSLVNGLSIRQRLPQIEVAAGDSGRVLVLRILESCTAADEEKIRAFARNHSLTIYLQPGAPSTAFCFHPQGCPPLEYTLAEFNVKLRFHATEFTQINIPVNAMLVRRALGLLNPQPGERIADFFCGLGNFSLPLARRGAQVVAFEGSAALVARARENAILNSLEPQVECHAADLFKFTEADLAHWGYFDKMLIDPPRDGAIQLIKAIGNPAPRRIVYVSCNPATLARDASVLVHHMGYALESAGIVNMFPHTTHVESIALFVK
jgi:23S rRNA (uracil1939-C5)-methyltransferase